jgi:hypothetical protein
VLLGITSLRCPFVLAACRLASGRDAVWRSAAKRRTTVRDAISEASNSTPPVSARQHDAERVDVGPGIDHGAEQRLG